MEANQLMKWYKSLSDPVKIAIISGIFALITAIAVAFITGYFSLASKIPPQATISPTATSQIISQATGTPTLISSPMPLPNPYPPNAGQLMLSDPLKDSSKGYMWDEFPTAYGTCSFHGGAYHVTSTQASDYHRCGAQNIGSFSNFAYEVEMTILDGDCGALIFRGDFINYHYYYFHICKDGSYQFSIFTQQGPPTTNFPQGYSPNINRGRGQVNLIAVVAINDTITVYANHQSIYSIHDGTYSQGQIGVAAENLNAPPTEVEFSNAHVWVL